MHKVILMILLAVVEPQKWVPVVPDSVGAVI
jgi:hypothetical protein